MEHRGRDMTRHGVWGTATRCVLGVGLLAGTLTLGVGVIGGQGTASAASTAACAPFPKVTSAEASSQTGVTAKSITVGNVSILTGPVPGLFEGAPIGVKAYFAYVNSKGGVYGRKLLLDSKDDAFSGEQNETETTQAISSDFAMVGSFSLFDNFGCKPLAANPAVPDVSVSVDPSTNTLPNNFSPAPSSVGLQLGPLLYYKKHYPKDMTVGSIVADVASSEAQWAGQEAALKHVGYKIAYVRDISPLESDFTTDVISMRKDHVNAVDLSALDWQIAAIFMQNAAAQGWHPGLIFSFGPVYADQFIAHAGGPSVTNGIQIGQVQSLYLGQDASTIPADREFLRYVKKINASWTPDLYTMYGWASAALFVQALKAAGPHPTRGAMLSQLAKITSFDAGGLIAPVNPAQKKPANCVLNLQIKNGKFQRVEPKTTGFDCTSTFFYAPQ
jgi:ABC-type branched-subunit amino acid transport system substrate-binding protein